MDRDESILPADATPEEESAWRWNEQQKEYTRNIMQNLLVEVSPYHPFLSISLSQISLSLIYL